MKITKQGKDKLTIVFDADDKKLSFYDFVNSDDLFWNDLSYHISGLDGWSYLIDSNQDKVFPINDYHWSGLDELREKGRIVLTAMDDDDAKDYLKEFLGDD
jgi:hypothetical protein